MGLSLSVCAGNVAAEPEGEGIAVPSAPDVSASERASASGVESTDAAARAAFEAGLEASRAEQWADAEREFRRSASFVRRQSTLYNWALSLYMQRRFRECLAVLDQFPHTNDGSGDARYGEYANELLKRARSEVSVIRLLVDPPSARVRIDGEAARELGSERSLEVLPGLHDAEVSAPECVTLHVSLTTTAGIDLERAVTLEHVRPNVPSPIPSLVPVEAPPAPFSVTTAPWIAIGVGGALLAAGAVTGVLALEADHELEQQCPATRNCDPSLRSDQNRVLALGRATDVLLVSGSVLLVGGVAWRLLVPAPASKVNGREVFLGASGRF